jgi:uncharacterized protein
MIALSVSMEALSELCKRHHVRELSVFGSLARGDARPDSDIDVLIEFDRTAQVGFVALARLTRELEELLRRRVDVVTKPGLHPRIRDAVLAEAEVLFAA